jgi:hypothetical protein
MYNYFMMGFGPTWVDASYGGSKVTRVPIPKVHINEKKVKNQCLVGLCGD